MARAGLSLDIHRVQHFNHKRSRQHDFRVFAYIHNHDGNVAVDVSARLDRLERSSDDISAAGSCVQLYVADNRLSCYNWDGDDHVVVESVLHIWNLHVDCACESGILDFRSGVRRDIDAPIRVLLLFDTIEFRRDGQER